VFDLNPEGLFGPGHRADDATFPNRRLVYAPSRQALPRRNAAICVPATLGPNRPTQVKQDLEVRGRCITCPMVLLWPPAGVVLRALITAHDATSSSWSCETNVFTQTEIVAAPRESGHDTDDKVKSNPPR